MIIHKIEDILGKLNTCIKYKKPFSHIRFGDGGLKFLHCILYNDIDQLDIIIKKEGLPSTKVVEVFELWGYYARRADFIDTPDVYFNGMFWPRIRKEGKGMSELTKIKMIEWKELYYRAEFDNENYCNPESNYLMVLRRPNHQNILDIMKGKKIALITAKPEIEEILGDYYVDIIKIVGHYEDHYKNSFREVMETIKHKANDYDFWMIAAGELGRIYTGYIKECGGRAIDIGFIAEFWLEGYLHPRLQPYLTNSIDNRFELILTDKGMEFSEYI